jgi:D-glycero-D-manno-heptose 1,7-bisphosphate phosphatase
MLVKRGLFLDLDGTIIKTVSGDKFPKDLNDWKFNDNILETIKLFTSKGFRVCIITNQGGIEKGFIRESDINIKLEKICEEIEKFTGFKPFYRFSPHFKDTYTRKPNPGMAYACALKLELSLTRSIMVGDMNSDRSFTVFAGIGNYLNIDQFLRINSDNFDEFLKLLDNSFDNKFKNIELDGYVSDKTSKEDI